jgi:hypothetical protein
MRHMEGILIDFFFIAVDHPLAIRISPFINDVGEAVEFDFGLEQ